MWSKIKNHLKRKPVTISVKLTVLYAAILFCILLLVSTLTVDGTDYLLRQRAEWDIDTSIQKVLAYLEESPALGPQMMEHNLLVSGVNLRVYNSQQQLIVENAPYAPGDRELHWQTPKPPKDHGDWLKGREQREDRPNWGLMIDTNDSSNTSFIKQVSWTSDQVYYLEFRKDMAEQDRFLHFLILCFIAVDLFGLIIAILSGNYLSRKILGPIRDVTNAAREIEVQNLDRRIDVKSSDDELKELALTFNHMLDRIQTGFDQQRRFISDASHELRTPLTVISGYADMLNRWGKQDDAALSEGIEAIQSEASHMQSMISKLLFLARADKGKLAVNIKTLKMDLLVDEVVRETTLIAPNHHIVVNRNDNVCLQADEGLIKQMLRIFIDNSVKYTAPGGSISINSEQRETFLDIIIKDNGIGIPEQDLSRVFDRFYRVDKSRTRITGGTGLGLAIAHQIAEQQHCQIEITSELGEGTAVLLRIPL